MAALTLVEAAKLETGNIVRSTIIEKYSDSSDILRVLPFESIQGGSLTYLTEEAYPGVGFRGVNEAYPASVGVLNPKTEVLSIAGGDLDVDNFVIATRGQRQRGVQELMKVRSLGLTWTQKFLKGSNASEATEFDGLQTRLTGDQKFANGTTANGTALSLAKLDEAIRRTYNPNYILMSSKMKIKFGAAARDVNVGGYIGFTPNEMGTLVMTYMGLPIITVDLDAGNNEMLGFDEAATSGTATATSIYVMSVGDEGVQGIQNGGIKVTDLGELDTAPKMRTRVEWYSGFGVFHGRAATRLWSIADAPITA